jgi:hypothetical protein
MLFLYGTGVGYGVGTGIWVDALAGVKDPGLAIIAPIGFGAAVPLGIYLWDENATLRRGVPSSIATGLTLGAVEGLAIAGTQWQHTRDDNKDWSFRTQATITFLTTTGGGIGGWAFGEWLRPDPRSLSFIASGAGWGALTGTLFGAGLTARNGDWKDGASIAGLVGYNAGILATGALSTFYTPSYYSQKWMWLGYGGGVAATSVVYIFYLASGTNASNGLIANAVGGLGGLTLAAVFTGNDRDPDQRSEFKAPFHISVGRAPGGGPMLQAFGEW